MILIYYLFSVLSLEIQSICLYGLVALSNGSGYSVEAGIKFFILGLSHIEKETLAIDPPLGIGKALPIGITPSGIELSDFE